LFTLVNLGCVWSNLFRYVVINNYDIINFINVVITNVFQANQ